MSARLVVIICFFMSLSSWAQTPKARKGTTTSTSPSAVHPAAAAASGATQHAPTVAPAPTAEEPVVEDSEQKKEVKEETRADYVAQGFFLSLNYENLKEKAELKFKSSNTSYSAPASEDLGFTGLRIGYGAIPKDGLGYNMGLTYERSSKKNYNNKNLSLMRGEGNLTIGTSINENFALYGFGGFHLSWIDPSNDVSPVGFGLQLGAGFAFSENWALEAGGVFAIHKFKDSLYDANPDLDKDGSYDTISGWLVRLNYNF
jgi:hypothetical protein